MILFGSTRHVQLRSVTASHCLARAVGVNLLCNTVQQKQCSTADFPGRHGGYNNEPNTASVGRVHIGSTICTCGVRFQCGKGEGSPLFSFYFLLAPAAFLPMQTTLPTDNTNKHIAVSVWYGYRVLAHRQNILLLVSRSRCLPV